MRDFQSEAIRVYGATKDAYFSIDKLNYQMNRTSAPIYTMGSPVLYERQLRSITGSFQIASDALDFVGHSFEIHVRNGEQEFKLSNVIVTSYHPTEPGYVECSFICGHRIERTKKVNYEKLNKKELAGILLSKEY